MRATKPTDIRPTAAALYFIPIKTRIPLKFGHEVVTSVTVARVKISVVDRAGKSAEGWGETPMSVQWVWPSSLPYEERHEAMLSFCKILAREWAAFDRFGHPMELGHAFQHERLGALLNAVNAGREADRHMPWLAALVCCSLFDLAVHDAYGILHHVPTYETYNAQYMNADLSAYLTSPPFAPRKDAPSPPSFGFANKYPQDFFRRQRAATLPAWHLVGGLDVVRGFEIASPNDGVPTLLADWIKRDGLKCLKIKLRGNDLTWDIQRILEVATVAIEHGVNWLSTDFNCTVHDPAYVNDILDRFLRDHPRIYGMILYVEQPFPYEIEHYPIDVHSVAARKPLFMDESAHDWRMVALGRALGWTGVALKTCKTQTGALLSACWAAAHGMTLMVQDLTNPMLAMIPHALLAAHVPTIMGVETNASQFYPEASRAEATVHPALFERRGGLINLESIQGPGFGYRVDEITRDLGAPVLSV